MTKIRIYAVLLLLVGALLGGFVHYSESKDSGFISKFPFKLGLDLSGGSHLVYQADTSKLATEEVDGAMNSLKAVIESRINAFGVAEPIVQTEKSTSNGQTLHKLIVELPGVTDVNQAVELIGKTPILEFKIEGSSIPVVQKDATTNVTADIQAGAVQYVPTQLTGRYLEKAQLQFDPNTNQPIVSLTFNEEGKKLFADLTAQNVGKTIAIFLDGRAISTPVVREPIRDGKAVISGRFTPAEAKTLAQDLRYGALPVPIDLVGTQSIGASLGVDALKASVNAGIWGFIIVGLFLLFWYRLPGLLAVISLAMYVIITLALFKIFGIVLTSAGLAGFIISMGMAVDGNILIFERMKEEFLKGYSIEEGTREGFKRAWLSIRDSNTSSIITGLILFFTATSPLIKGFALVFILGVFVSMFTSITVSRTLLLALGAKRFEGVMRFLFGHGLRN
ncbi:MAG: protein translocase subunit SecD [Candidatus Taylorbacteria bacterium]|nr:protein translocase subunit SecD [Candidatus Taylorbacteria bacterium]